MQFAALMAGGFVLVMTKRYVVGPDAALVTACGHYYSAVVLAQHFGGVA